MPLVSLVTASFGGRIVMGKAGRVDTVPRKQLRGVGPRASPTMEKVRVISAFSCPSLRFFPWTVASIGHRHADS